MIIILYITIPSLSFIPFLFYLSHFPLPIFLSISLSFFVSLSLSLISYSDFLFSLTMCPPFSLCVSVSVYVSDCLSLFLSRYRDNRSLQYKAFALEMVIHFT